MKRVATLTSLAAAMLLSVPAAAAPIVSEVEAAGPQGPLRGTLLMPAGVAHPPVVLIIPGSGPTDRDGNNPLNIKGSSYRLLAEALAGEGIATLRVDKRGMFGSAAAILDANAATIPAYADDVRAWSEVARRRAGASCTWLLGHSEGGLVVLAAALKTPDLCGVILAAAPGRRLSDVMREQFRANPANAPILDDALRALDALEAGQTVDVSAMHPALQNIFAPPVQGLLASLFAHDPADLAEQWKGPLLIVQGLNDIQVKEADARRLAAAQPAARIVLLPDVTHMLKVFKPTGMAEQLAHYADPAAPISAEVVSSISGFVKAKPSER